MLQNSVEALRLGWVSIGTVVSADTWRTYTRHHLDAKFTVSLLITFREKIVDSWVKFYPGEPVSPAKGRPRGTDEACYLRVVVDDHVWPNSGGTA